MRDDNSGAFIGVQRLRDLLLRQVVQRGRRLVEDQDIGLGRDRPRDQKPLLLSAGDSALPLGDHGLHAHRHLPDVLRKARRLSRLPGGVHSQPRGRNSDIFVDTAHQELAVLHDDADVSAQRPQVQTVEILAVEEYGALPGLFKSQKEPHQRRFAASGLPDDRHILPCLDLDAQIVQDIGHCVGIAEADVRHLDIASQSGHDLLAACDFRLLLQNGSDHFQRRADARDHKCYGGNLHKSAGYIAERTRKGDIVVIRHAAVDGGAVHDHRSDQGDRRADHRVELDDHGRVIEELRFLGVQSSPAGEGALLRAGQLDLLDSRDHRVVHAALLCSQLHGVSRDLRVEERRYDREHESSHCNGKSRDDQRRRIVEDLRDIDQRKDRGDAGGKDRGSQLFAQLRDRLRPRVQLTGTELSEERGRE